MNYIAQINAFNDWASINCPSTGQYALYYALLDINNRCGWKEWFNAANSIIESRTGLTKMGINRARSVLSDNGLIEFEARKGNQATMYRIVPMGRISDANSDAKVYSNNSIGRISDANAYADVTQMHTIPKQETKTETKNSSVPKAFSIYQNEIGIVSPNVSQMLIDDVETYGDEWVCEAIQEAVKSNVRKYAYVNSILKRWGTTGRGSSKIAQTGVAARTLPTPSEVKLQDEQRKKERQEALRREMFGE